MPAGLQVFLARRVEGVGRVDVDVGIVLGDHGEAPVVVHVLMGLDEGVDLVVGKHDVDALALEARVHPVVIPPGIEQVTGCLAFHALDLDEAGVAARVVGMDAVFLGDGPRRVDLVRHEVLDPLEALLERPLAHALAVAEGRPVEGVLVHEQPARAGHVVHKDAVVEPARLGDVGDLDRLAHSDVRRAALHFGKEGPAERRIRVQTHGAEHARAHAERGALHEFASVHIVPPIEPE